MPVYEHIISIPTMESIKSYNSLYSYTSFSTVENFHIAEDWNSGIKNPPMLLSYTTCLQPSQCELSIKKKKIYKYEPLETKFDSKFLVFSFIVILQSFLCVK